MMYIKGFIKVQFAPSPLFHFADELLDTLHSSDNGMYIDAIHCGVHVVTWCIGPISSV